MDKIYLKRFDLIVKTTLSTDLICQGLEYEQGLLVLQQSIVEGEFGTGVQF